MLQLPLDIRSIVFSFYDVTQDEFCTLCNTCDMDSLYFFKFLRAPILQKTSIICKCFQSACKDGHSEVVSFLTYFLTIDDIRANDNQAFRSACDKNHVDVLHVLSRFLTRVDICADNSMPFRTACVNGRFETVKFLTGFLTLDDMRAGNDHAFGAVCY